MGSKTGQEQPSCQRSISVRLFIYLLLVKLEGVDNVEVLTMEMFSVCTPIDSSTRLVAMHFDPRYPNVLKSYE